MRIAVFGAGGVGGYFGGRLAATGNDVTFIARGAHLAALRDRGLSIRSPLGDVQARASATDDPGTIGPVDIVFLAVKLYDTESVLKLLPPLLGPKTLVVPFQNGVETVDTLTRAVGRAHVAGGTAYVAAVIAEPGVIRHTAMNAIVMGALDDSQVPALDEFVNTCKAAGIDASRSNRIVVDIWAKFARLAAFSGMTALVRSAIGPIREDPDLNAMMHKGVRETIAVARAKQIPLPHNLFDDIVAALDSVPPTTRSSMLEDLERGRPLELPWLSGAVVRIGQESGVDAPTHRLIVTLLRPHIHGQRPTHS